MLLISSYIASIVLANVLLYVVGILNIFGVLVPAGVFPVGVTFTLRDFIQDKFGSKIVVLLIIIGALLSGLLSLNLMLASGTAFLFSEISDFVVYSKVRKVNWYAAIFLSNTVGLVVDSCLFLYLAFGSLDYLLGQVIGKLFMTILALIVIKLGRINGRRN